MCTWTANGWWARLGVSVLALTQHAPAGRHVASDDVSAVQRLRRAAIQARRRAKDTVRFLFETSRRFTGTKTGAGDVTHVDKGVLTAGGRLRGFQSMESSAVERAFVETMAELVLLSMCDTWVIQHSGYVHTMQAGWVAASRWCICLQIR